MSWSDPLVLGIIPVSLALVWWFFRPQPAAGLAAFANIRRLWADRRGLSDSGGAHRRRGRGILLALGAALALLALARPQWGKVEETSYDQSREVLLALDLSRSMLAGDVSPTRLDRAKLLIESLLDQLKGERVGLAVFAGTSFLQSPLSADYEVLREFLRDLDPSYLPQGGTDYGAMLRTSLQAFGAQGDGDRYLVVLSDGEAHDEEWKSLVPALKQKGIKVVGLGVGTAEGAVLPDARGGVMKDENGAAVLSKLEPETLRQLAAETGGTYRDAAAWVDIAELVHATVDQGRTGSYVEQKNVHLRDQYQWFLAPALLFFLLSYWLDFPVLPVPRLLRRPQQVLAPVRAAAAAALLVAFLLPISARASVGAESNGDRSGAGINSGRGGAGTPRPTLDIENLVGELSSKPDLGAGDYARLATTTIETASQPNAMHGPSRLGVIGDALLGVDEGEKLDAKAADWPQLRQTLERLREEEKKQEQQKQDEQKQEQQQNAADQQKQEQGSGSQQKDQQDQKGGESQPQQDAKNQQGNGGQQQQDAQQKPEEQKGDSSAQPQQNAGESDEPQDQQSGASGDDGAEKKQNENRDEQQGAAAARAEAQEQKRDGKGEEPQPLQDEQAHFGKLDEPKPEQKAAAGEESKDEKKDEKPQAPMRMIGGGQVQEQPADGKDVALVGALDRMQRIKDGDSPATLFDRMNRAEGVPPQKKTGKNW